MQEDLLGYLLGALEPDEMRRVEQWLRTSEDGRRELAHLERMLAALEESELADPVPAEELMPPPDLVGRTLANLPPLPPPDEDEVLGETRDESRDDRQHDAPPDRIGGGPLLSPVNEGGTASTWGLRDWAGSVAAAAILIAISLPALSEGRFAARKATCQDHLRDLGVAMTQFASRNAQSRLPSVAPAGYQAFAGVYALRLHEAGLLDNPQKTLCPSVDRDAFWPFESRPVSLLADEDFDGFDKPTLVTLQTLDELARDLMDGSEAAIDDPAAVLRVRRAIEKLRWIQLTAGGQYSYTLGVRDGEHFSSPRFQSRSHFAVMSDAAITNVRNPSGVSPSTYHTTVLSHGGRGINVLYEDGHVGFLPTESLDRIPDNPLLNHNGLIEAGVTIDDASLAPSWHPPFIRANQR